MDQSYWLRQTTQPLFSELEWSRPETKQQAGKLLVIGGSAHGFAAPAEAYGVAEKAGIGAISVMLPDSLQRSVSKLFPAATFAPSTPSGSFASSALAELLEASLHADAVLLPGDISRNSETTVVIENLLEKYDGQVTLTKDAADLFCQQPISILQRPKTLFVISMGQLRRLGSEAHYPRAFTSEMGLVQLIEALHEFTKRFSFTILTRHQEQYIIADNGRISSTTIAVPHPIWRLERASAASVWWLQNPNKPLEALTMSVFSKE
jgi:NAD(P)H-hydrate repair Nnr-like enzyme with NAD(P)H-hydrate dehydratase domain